VATLDDDIFNPTVARIRARLQAVGSDLSTVSNKDLLLQMAEEARNEGGLDYVGERYGEGFKNQYLDIVNAPEPGREGFIGGIKEIPEGLGRGYEGMKSTALGGLGLAAGTLGFEDAESSLMESAAEAQQRASEYNPSISRASDVRWDNPSEVIRFLSGGFGEALPSTVEAAGSFALGAGVGGLVGRGVVKSRLKETLKNVVKRKGDETAEQAIKRTFSMAGMQLGLGTSSIGLGVGEIYTELYPYTQVDSASGEYIDPDKAKAIAIGFGTLAGSLDLLSAGLQLNKIIGIGDEASTRYLKRLLYNLPEGVVVEGATESAQEFINIAAEKYSKGKELTFNGEELERMFDAGVLGALGGVQFSAAGAIRLGQGNKKTGDDLLGSESDDDPSPGGGIPDDFKMADELESTLNEIDEADEEVSFKAGDQVAVFREGKKISGTVSSINDTTAIVDSKVKVGDKEVTTRVEVDLAREGLFNDTFVPEEEDLTPEVDEPEVVDTDASETPTVYEDFSYNEKSVKIEPQEKEVLEKAIKAYEDSAQKVNGVSSQSATPKKDFAETTGINSQSKLGQKVYQQLKDLDVIDKDGKFTKPTAKDQKLEQDAAKLQVTKNKNKVKKLFGKTSDDGRRVTVPDPVGQKVAINNSAEPYTITSYDPDTGEMRAEQVTTRGGKIINRPVKVDADGAFDVATDKRIGNVRKFTKRGKVGNKKTEYRAYQSAENEDIFFSEEAPEGGYIPGLGGEFTTAEQKSVMLQDPIVLNMNGGIPNEQDMEIAQRNLATNNDGVVFENVGFNQREIIITRNQGEVYETRNTSIRNKMGELGYSEAEMDEVFNPVGEVLGEDPILPLIGSIVGNHQFERSSPFIGKTISREELMADSPDRSGIDEKYIDSNGEVNAIRWAYDNKRSYFTGKSLSTSDMVQGNNLGVSETFDFDPDAVYEFRGRDAYDVIEAKTQEEFEEALYRKRPKGTKKIFKNRSENTGGYYEFASDDYGKSFTLGDVEFKKPVPDEQNAYLPLLDDSLEQQQVSILSVENRLSPRQEKGEEGEVLVILQADTTRDGLEEGNVRIAQLDKTGKKIFDSVKVKKDGKLPVNRYTPVQDLTESSYTMIGQVKLFEPHSERIDLMYTNLSEFLSDPEVQAVTGYDGEVFVPSLNIPKVSGARGERLKQSFSAIQQIERLQKDKPKDYKKRIKGLQSILDGLQAEKILLRDTETKVIESALGTLNTKFSAENGLIEADLKDVMQIYPMLDPVLQKRITDLLNKGEGSSEATFFTDLLELTVSDQEVKEQIRDLKAKFASVDAEKLYAALRNSPELGSVISEYSEIYRQLTGYQNQSSEYIKTLNDGIFNLTQAFKEVRSKLGMPEISNIEKHALDAVENISASAEMKQLQSILATEGLRAYRELVEQGVIIPYTTNVLPVARWGDFGAGTPEYNDWVEYSKKNPIRKEKDYGIPAIRSKPAERFEKQIKKKFEEVIRIATLAEDQESKKEQTRAVENILSRIKTGDSTALDFKALLFEYIRVYTDQSELNTDGAEEIFDILDSEAILRVVGRAPIDAVDRLILEVQHSDEFNDFMRDNKGMGILSQDIKDKIFGSMRNAYGVPSPEEKIWKVTPSKKPRGKRKQRESEKFIIAKNKFSALSQYRELMGLPSNDTGIKASTSKFGTSIYKRGAQTLANNLADMFRGGVILFSDEDNRTTVKMSNMGAMPKGYVDMTTGREMETDISPLNEEDIEGNRAGRIKQTGVVAFTEEHPMELTGMQEQLGEARAAIGRFTEANSAMQGLPFPAISAVNRVLKLAESNKATKYWAQAIQRNKDLVDGMTVRFVPWSEFRKYATTREDQISTAVYLQSKNEILVSDLFYDNPSITADEQLSSVIVHEIIHGPTKLAMDIGYMQANGHELPGKMDSTDAETLGRIYRSLDEVVLPELREKLGNADYVHGLSSVDEFWSEVASNPKFRKSLSRTRFSAETKKKLGISKSWISNAWDYVKAILAKFFGLETNTESLKWANEQLDKVLESAQQLTPMRHSINAVNARGVGSLHMLGGEGAIKVMGDEFAFEWFDGTKRVLINPKELQIKRNISWSKEGIFEDGEKISDTTQMIKLSDLVEWDQLFYAYPGLENIDVTIDPNYRAEGSYIKEVASIQLGLGGFTERDLSEKDTISTLIHEMQHAIDTIDGNPGGFSPSAFKLNLPWLKKSKLWQDFMMGMADEGSVASIHNWMLIAHRNINTLKELVPNDQTGVIQDTIDNLEKVVSILSPFEIYKSKSGEVTAFASENIYEAMNERLEQELADYREAIKAGKTARHPALNFGGMLANNAWRFNYTNFHVIESALKRAGKNDLAELFSPHATRDFEALGMYDKAVPTPDASERVFQEGDVAAVNEVVSLLAKAYNKLSSKGMVTQTPEEFLKDMAPGKVGTEGFYKRLAKGIDDPESIRIGDQGRNQVTRTHASNKAIDYISQMLRGRKQKNTGILDKLDQAERTALDINEQIEDFNELFKGVIKKGLATPEDISKTMLVSMKKLTIEQIRDIAAQVKKPIRKSAMDMDDVKTSDIVRVVNKIVDIDTFEDLTTQEKNDAIENLNDRQFSGNTPEDKYRRMALLKVLESQKDTGMFLYRMATDKLGQGVGSERNKLIRDLNKIVSATKTEQLDGIKYESTFTKRLDTVKKKRKNLFLLVELLDSTQKEKEMLKELHNVINPTYKRLRASMGELEPTDIGDGKPMTIMRLNRNPDGKPVGGYTKETIVISLDKNGAINNPGFDKAISETLHFARDPVNVQKYGDQPWFRNMSRNAQVALMDPSGGLKDKYFTQRKNWHLGSLESVGQAMSRFGPAGKKIGGLISQVIGQTRDLQSQVKVYAIAANKAFVRVSKELGLNGSSIYSEVWQDMAFWFDNHPEYYGREDVAFSEMWKWLRNERPMHLENVKDMNRARDAVRFWVNKEVEAKNHMRYVNEEVLGNRIRDDQVTVQSELDGSQVDFYRRPIDLGFSTWSRSLNNHAISSVVMIMRNNLNEEVNTDTNREKLLQQLSNSAQQGDMPNVDKLMSLLYGDDQVISEFVEPFILGGVRRSAFTGPDGAPVGNSQFAMSWKKSGKDMMTFLNDVFDTYSENDGLDSEQEDQARFEWYDSFAKQLNSRYKRLVRADTQVANDAHNVMKASEAIKNTPRSLDSRQIESKLPKKFFYYDIHDEVSTQIRLAMMVATSVFGRNGMKINNIGQGFYDKMKDRKALFNNIMTEATRGVHEAPQMTYSGAAKKEAYRILKDQFKESNPKLAWERLYNDAVTYREFGKVFDQLGQYYGKGNISGAYGDANVLLELLGTQSLLVLNNPKSSFWQTLALGEFPMAFRGLNRMSGKATGAALANMFDQSFGGILEAMNFSLPKTSRLARSLNNTHFRTPEMELPLKDLLTQVGPNGEMVNGTKTNSFKKGIRFVKNAIAHSRQYNPDGSRQSFDAFTMFTGLFPWANGVINHSVGVGTATAYESEILRIAKHIQDQGNDIFDPREFTAEELGMNNSKTAEMVIGERDGWNNMNNMLLENGTSSMSRLAFDYLQRRVSNPDAPVLEHNTVLMMNQVGMSNVSGEGFNAKIPALYNNGLMRYAGIFLGWPIWKMAQSNRFIGREAGDELGSYMAFIKYLGLLSAVYMPLGLSAAFLVDWYDEEIVGKPNNLPPLTPWAMMPVVGPLFALSNEESTIYALTSRLARAGNIYGMGFELANSMFATGDPFGAAKEFSLDSRLFMFNTFRNVRDALGTWYHQGEADYGNVIRPMMYGLGLGSVIQQMDIVTNLMDIDIEERRVADYLSAKNLIKKASWVMGLPLTPPAKGYGKPSPVSINLRQMERAAYANDKTEFFKQYQEAISAAKVYIEENGMNTTAEKYVHERFRQRNLRYGITKGRISDADWKRILEIQDADDRVMLENYLGLHEFYLNQIGTKQSSLPSASQLRRMALLGVPMRY